MPNEDKEKQEAEAAAKKQADDAMKAAIEKARLEERAKLRGEIDTLTQKVKDSEMTTKQQAEELQRLKDIEKALEKSKGENGVDVKAAITEVAERVANEERSKRQEELKKQQDKIRELEEKLNKRELEDRRRELIEQAGGEKALIPSLVKGNTVEELVASIEESKKIFDSVRRQVAPGSEDDEEAQEEEGTDPTQQNRNDQVGSKAPPVVGGNNNRGAGRTKDATLLNKVKTMTPKEYMANRDQILADLKRRHPQTASR